MSSERRQHPRVLAAQRLEAYILETALLVRVVDVSAGGLGGVSRTPVPVGNRCLCEIRSNGASLIRIAARAVYCRPRPGYDDFFEVGFAFLDPADTLTQAMAGTLIEHVTSVLEFDEPPRL